jgi:DNA repair exonuclease SbcCD ATPase subunit
MIVISGPNGAGKSSFCDAIMTALAGKDKAIKRPIKDGEKRATIEIELDGYVVRKYFAQGSDAALSVRPTGAGADIKKPQSWLNEHIGNLKFDPSEFARLDEKKQRELLIQIAGLNLDDYDKSIEKIFEDRKFSKKELSNMFKTSEADIHNAKRYSVMEEVVVSDLMEKYNNELDIRNKFLHAQSRIKSIDNEIAELQREKLRCKAIEDTKINIESLKCDAADAEETNTLIRAAKTTLNNAATYKQKEDEVNEFEENLKIVREEKNKAVEEAKYPIEGLSIDDDGVLYNGVPFSQINDSQKIVIGCLIAIALMPKDNPIKIIFIKLGSLLDDKALSYLEKISEEQDVQFVIEFVGGNKGFNIVEGEIVNQE